MHRYLYLGSALGLEYRADGSVTVTFGPRVLFCFDGADTVAEAGMAGKEVAALLGLSADYFSTLRVGARRRGSAGPVRPMGRPPKLAGADVAKARRWSAEGMTGTEIARRLGVSGATVSRALAGVAVAVELVLEARFHAEQGAPGSGGLGSGGLGDIPGGEDLAAEVERFLREQGS